MCRYKLSRILGLAVYIIALHWTVSVHAAPGALSDIPLFTSSNVPPNVFFEVDDSGSMDWEVLTKAHWHYCAYDRNGSDTETSAGDSNCGHKLESGTSTISHIAGYYNYNYNYGYYFPPYDYNAIYIFEEDDNVYGDDSSSCNSYTIQNCTDSRQKVDWRLFSSDLNTIYYNPSVEYKPWQGASFTDADFSSVRSDPQPSSDGYNDRRNLKDGISSGSNTGFIYEVWEDSHKFKDDRPRRGSNQNRKEGSNGLVDLWDKHTRYYVKENEIIEQKIKYRVRDDEFKEEVESTKTYSGTDTLNGRTIAEVQQNIANWYQYHRRRYFVAKAAIGNVITENPQKR
jgi:type IV pilus assembly protein PilY1